MKRKPHHVVIDQTVRLTDSPNKRSGSQKINPMLTSVEKPKDICRREHQLNEKEK